MFIHPYYTLYNPPEPTLYHPHPPTHLSPFLFQLPSSCSTRFTLIHPHSLSIWVPLPPLLPPSCNSSNLVVVLGGGEAPALVLSPFLLQMYEEDGNDYCPHFQDMVAVREVHGTGVAIFGSEVLMNMQSSCQDLQQPILSTFVSDVVGSNTAHSRRPELLTAKSKMMAVLLVVVPCSLVDTDRHLKERIASIISGYWHITDRSFKGVYCLHTRTRASLSLK